MTTRRQTPKHARFRIQKRVQVKARDLSNREFLFSEIFRTVAEADHIGAAEMKLNAERRDHTKSKFRLVEVGPRGAEHVIHNWQ